MRNAGWWRSSALSCTVAWFAALAACSDEQTAEPPRFDESVCPFAVDPSQVQGSTMRCGVLYTPEVHASPTRLIQVPVLVFKGTSATAPPLVFLSGGPGQSWADLGLDQLTASQTRSSPMDRVFIEQRGTGLSRPRLDCPGLQESDDLDSALVAACISDLRAQGVAIAAYNIQEMAEDVVTLQSVLGYPTIALDGVSYGTAWALQILRAHSASVDFAVLDSVVNPAIPMLGERASATDTAFDALFAACSSDGACAAAYGDLKATMVSALANLQARPLALAATGELYDDNRMFWDAVAVLAFAPDLLPRMIAEVSAAIANGTGQMLLDSRLSALLEVDAQALSHSALGQRASVLCADNQFVTTAQAESDLARVTVAFRPYLDEVASVEGCHTWPYQRRSQADYSAVTSSVPTLLLSGSFDPLTAPDWARQAASTLSHGYWVELPGLGHGAGSSSANCPKTILSHFLLSADPPDTTCVQSMRVAFAAPVNPSARMATAELRTKVATTQVPALDASGRLAARSRFENLRVRRHIERSMAELAQPDR